MKKRSLALIMAMVCTLSLVGCGKDATTGEAEEGEKVYTAADFDDMKKSDLQTLAANLQNNLNRMLAENTQLKSMLSGVQGEEAPGASVTSVGNGNVTVTMESVNERVIFPDGFDYPNSEQTANNVALRMAEGITIVPSSNWYTRINGTTIEVQHVSGITGVLRIGDIKGMLIPDQIKEQGFQPFFEDLPPSTLSYKNIFIGEDPWGVQATTPTLIDSEDAVLRCGMAGYSSHSIVYIFTYKGGTDATKEETITSLLNTISWLNNNFRVE